MGFWAARFGTPTEKKREQYKALYDDLDRCWTDFYAKLKKVTEKVSNYTDSRVTMSESFIPEDVFSTSESSVKEKVMKLKSNQEADSTNLIFAIDAAYQRYQYYAQLAEDERIEREAEQRRKLERLLQKNREM